MAAQSPKSSFKDFDKAVDIAYAILAFQMSEGEKGWTDAEYSKYFKLVDELADTVLREETLKQRLSSDDFREFLQSTLASVKSPEELTKTTIAGRLRL